MLFFQCEKREKIGGHNPDVRQEEIQGREGRRIPIMSTPEVGKTHNIEMQGDKKSPR